MIAGVDSSTQSTKVEIRDQETGRVLGRGSRPHPAVTPPRSEQDPRAWWEAFEGAFAEAERSAQQAQPGDRVRALSVAGQQHGMVALDAGDQPVVPAKLWNDTESSPDAEQLVRRLGSDGWASAVGSVPVAAFTITKLHWLHRTNPSAWDAVRRIVLPHDYLTLRLTGEHVTDRGDASGTGYWSPAEGGYRLDLLDLVDGDRDWASIVPTVRAHDEAAGVWQQREDVLIGPGTGDNMGAALGIGLRPGDAVISIGTSGTVYCVADVATADPSGAVAGFADATGRYLPLVCTSNAARVIDSIARLLDVDHERFDDLAFDAAGPGPVLLPYLDGERTPNRPHATGVLAGIRSDVSRAQLARAAVLGVVCGLLDGIDALRAHAHLDGRFVLVGGGTRSRAVRAAVASLIDAPVIVSDATEAVATGAAVQAAAVTEGADAADVQRRWGLGGGAPVERELEGIDPIAVRERYAELRDSTTGPADR